MPLNPPILTFLSDFGTRDFYVAAVKGVILAGAPGATLIDISHQVEPGDLATASFLLEAVLPSFPPGAVHLAVVDPGVGSARRLLAIETLLPGHSRPSWLLGPDNGIFEPFLDAAIEVLAIDRPDLYRQGPGATFHGRDRFAPVAAALLRGESFAALGAPLADPCRAPRPRPEPFSDGDTEGLRGVIEHIDRFGNLVSNLPAAALPPWARDGGLRLAIAGRVIENGVGCYAEIPAGQAAWLIGSLGRVELSLDSVSLAAAWGIQVGESLRIYWPRR